MDTLVLDGPIRNGAGQVGTGLRHVRTLEICYLYPATPEYSLVSMMSKSYRSKAVKIL